jgi:hypothetical protein
MRRDADLAARLVAPAGVMAATTFVACLVAASDEEGRFSAALLALASLYATAVSISAWSRRRSRRASDTWIGLLVPPLGYGTAAVMAVAAPLLVFDALYRALGPLAPPMAILAGMASVMALMATSRMLDVHLDPFARGEADILEDHGSAKRTEKLP